MSIKSLEILSCGFEIVSDLVDVCYHDSKHAGILDIIAKKAPPGGLWRQYIYCE